MHIEYITPETDILEIRIEQVFATSGEDWTYDEYEDDEDDEFNAYE